jgi:histidine triad (HIT) family protein
MSGPANCIFCKIAAGEIPSESILETEEALAFLDINPLAPGHVLLIPKQHHLHITDMSADAWQRVTQHLPRLARAVKTATGADGFNVLQNNGRVAGQAVDHVHFHIIPRRENDGLGYRWNAGSYGEGEARAMRDRINGALGA